MEYRTKQGDVLDEICFNHYGREGLTEFVLQANRGLSSKGPVFPSGIIINLPPAPVKKPVTITLFD